ncbi:DUF1573 domain-containing protein [Flavihumibacter rivuli]|uniref:DUF1573 domain-containing protein n=1 Tax=Flavihumibacter rivuli TaxID=2838156 RepID=UPI001BDDE133|nr:DUF1573 domain-containing protein [Flavihumibacter rivuli]ULQ57962.1 DUF1573 domain-containing protein [Flavihumibacter rivuli]
MRNAFILFSLLAIMASCERNAKSTGNVSNSPSPANAGLEPMFDSSAFTKITWLENDKDFGKIQEGQKLEVSFQFRNTGDKPLIITRVSPSCGCTAAEPPKEPIAPGQEGTIRATFDSNGRQGMNHKTLYVEANTFGGTNHILQFKVEVDPKPVQ